MNHKVEFSIFRKLTGLFLHNKVALLSLLFILAATTRFVFIKFSGGFFSGNASDTIVYLARAESLLNGKISSFSTLGFTVYLAFLLKLLGSISVVSLKIANIVIGSLTVLVIFFAGERFYNKQTGILAALLCIFHINLIFWTGYILTETPFLLFLSLAVLYSPTPN